MAISYPLSFPSVSIRDIVWEAKTKVASTESPFTGEQQFIEHEGQWFEAQINLPPLERAEAEDFVGFLLALNGQKGTFTFSDPDYSEPRGTALGTPLINGASQTGSTIVTDGWTPSQGSLLLRGDWIQIGSYMYKIAQDASSDGSGNATLEVFPNLRSSPADNAAITTSSPTGLYRLSSNMMTWSVNDLMHYGISITIREAI
jgi:hypothetical protein